MFSASASGITSGTPSNTVADAVTVLQLTGDGTNGATNNTFIDSSPNNFTMTRVGNITQGSFTPFSADLGKWSGSFNGTTDYYITGSSTALGFGTGDFTIECWVYPNDVTTAGRTILDFRQSGVSNSTKPTLYLSASGTLTYYTNGGAQISKSILAGKWSHIAVCRSSGVTKLFVDGVQAGTSYSNSGDVGTTGDMVIGQMGYARPAGGAYWSGLISNVRVIKTALYTNNFTPSTTPLATTQNSVAASLLMLCGNRSADYSANSLMLNQYGSPVLVPSSPFSGGSTYSASTNGGSLYINGSASGVMTPLSTAFNIGSGNWTMECWVYLTSIPNYAYVLNLSDGATTYMQISVSTAGAVNCGLTGAWTLTSSTNPINTGSWHHIALVRSSNTITIYVNGVSNNTVSYSGSVSPSFRCSTGNIWFSGAFSSGNAANGYVAGARIVVGTAVYTSNFAVPTSPPSVITNTAVLLNFKNAVIYDASGKTDIETVGDSRISTTQSKFGGSSMYFDGTGDYLSTSNRVYALPGDFTIECWVRFESIAHVGVFHLTSALLPGNNTGLALSLGDSPFKWRIYANGTEYNATEATPTISTWYHVALVRSGTTTKLYVNGTATSISVTDTTSYTGTVLAIGGAYSTGYLMTGYVDNFRITAGTARYLTNFTPSTSGFN